MDAVDYNRRRYFKLKEKKKQNDKIGESRNFDESSTERLSNIKAFKASEKVN